MKALIYVNEEKNKLHDYYSSLKKELIEHGVKAERIREKDFLNKVDADVLFVIGGDGTVLSVSKFASDNNLPVIGVNVGKMGYLNEFESSEIGEAVYAFINGELIKDERICLSAFLDGKNYFALNDVVLQRKYTEKSSSIIARLSVYIDGVLLDKISGDGVIICSPTGSTAYSLSAGGAILAPHINAFSMTPISAHSLFNRPVVYSSESKCEIKVEDGSICSLFIDGVYFGDLPFDKKIEVKKSENKVVFLRRKNSNFYKRLINKL